MEDVMAVESERALGLSDRCDFVLRHCSAPMSWKGTQTRWEGKPGEGFEIHAAQYECSACGAEVSMTAKEPC